MTEIQLPSVFKSKTPKVYKNKKLNTANFGNFTNNDYQLFLHLISKVGGVDEFGKYLQPHQLQREHTITAKEFSEFFNTDISNSYRLLKKAIDKLMKADISLERPENQSVIKINICSKAEYIKKSGRIHVEFTDSIMPYLSQVRKKFVLYNLKEIANFGSLYTTRLYELIQEFQQTGYMIKSIEQLKKVFGVKNKFKLYKDFKRRTFEHACQEINDNYKMNLDFEEIKDGRKVVAIKFIFKKTKVHKVINQQTGIEKNVYQKPAVQTKKRTPKTKNNKTNVIEGQLSLIDVQQGPKPIQNILSRVLNKFKS